MEIFRQIEERFASVDQRFIAVETALRNVQTNLTGMREDIQGLRGCFASIEAIMIANAAQHQQHREEIATLKARMDTMERKAS